ncbi:lactococcin 972 family bacteriocin [Streptomyces sp. NBC_00887]|uniref:lactococcin 972 family bacteriocin n=1 Tax=Streptomyces sp. NBC_00887 TaxID=2975859 RepID=UPI002F9170A1
MKAVGKSFTFAVVSAALAAGVIAPAATASAATPEPTGGMVTLTFSEGTSVMPLTTIDVGGGVWTYGADTSVSGSKRCYSYYHHGTKMHKATVKMAGLTRSGAREAGATARAEITAGAAYTCQAFWSNLE